MKKSYLILCIILLLIPFNFTAQSLSNTTFTTTNSGWYKIGKWTASQRGSERIVISLYGGSYAPQELILDVFKDWSDGFYIESNGIRNYHINKIRITKDTNNYYYVEAYFKTAILNNGNIHLYSLGGKRSGFAINSGHLIEGTGTVIYETGNIHSTLQIGNNLDVKKNISVNGNVGIGTTETGNHKLAVEGSIGAREIKVEATGWSDFVFYDNYKLPTLNEVENHIKEKGHLKDIPSAKEVAENGIYLGEMDSKLLQKIEELTLYTISQEKKINKQNSKLIKQEQEITELKSLNKKLLDLQKRLETLEKK